MEQALQSGQATVPRGAVARLLLVMVRAPPASQLPKVQYSLLWFKLLKVSGCHSPDPGSIPGGNKLIVFDFWADCWGEEYLSLPWRPWHLPCQRTPLACNLVCTGLLHAGAQKLE